MTAKRKLAKKKGGKREGGTQLESFLLSSDRWKQPFPVLLIIVMKTHRSGDGSNSGKERNGRREEIKQKKEEMQTNKTAAVTKWQTVRRAATYLLRPATLRSLQTLTDWTKGQRDDRKEQLCHFSSAVIVSKSCSAPLLPHANAR